MISRRQLLLSVPLAASLPAFARAAADGARNPVGCQTNAWPIKKGFAELLEHVAELKRLDFGGFECNVRFVESQFSAVQEARAQIRATGLRFYGPHSGLRSPASAEEPFIEGAAAVGAERFVLSGSGKMLKADGTLDEEAVGKKVEALNQVGQRCREAGLRLAYHNHTAEFQAHGAEIEALLARTDPRLVFLLLDIGHAHRSNCDVPAFVERHHARIDALHLRDIRQGKTVPLGEGELDFTALAAVVRKAQWPGWLTLEEDWRNKDSPERIFAGLQASRQVIRQHFGV